MTADVVQLHRVEGVSVKGTVVTLTKSQIMRSGLTGLWNWLDCEDRNAVQRHGADYKSFAAMGVDMLGTFGEIAVAAYLNMFWPGNVGQVGAPDVGGIVEVRATLHATGRLRLSKGDPDVPFVLVYARPPEFELVGWIMGANGKRPEYWLDPGTGRPAFFVPRQALSPMVELLSWDARRRIGLEGKP